MSPAEQKASYSVSEGHLFRSSVCARPTRNDAVDAGTRHRPSLRANDQLAPTSTRAVNRHPHTLFQKVQNFPFVLSSSRLEICPHQTHKHQPVTITYYHVRHRCSKVQCLPQLQRHSDTATQRKEYQATQRNSNTATQPHDNKCTTDKNKEKDTDTRTNTGTIRAHKA